MTSFKNEKLKRDSTAVVFVFCHFQFFCFRKPQARPAQLAQPAQPAGWPAGPAAWPAGLAGTPGLPARPARRNLGPSAPHPVSSKWDPLA